MNEQLLKSLNQKRGGFKSQLTLFSKFLSNLGSENLTSINLQNLESRLHKIQPIYELFNEVQGEIEYLDETNEDDQLVERETFQDTFFESTSKASNILLTYREQDIIQFQTGQDDKNSNATQSPKAKGSVRLPTINLPTFDGEFTLWREFYDAFNAIIHTNQDITDVQKLTYLKATLKGEPAGLLRSFETTNQNYDIAWTLLQKRYDNKRRIINNHVQALLDISQMSRESYESLKQIINTTQIHVQCLKSLGIPVDSWDAILVPIIAAKLDFQTNKEWEAKLNVETDNYEKVPSIELLLEFLNNKQNTLETITKRKANDQIKPKPGHNTNSRDVKAFIAVDAACTCAYCNENHLIPNCESFLNLDVNTRNKRVRELKLCLNCLRKGHFVPNCKSKYSCRKCNKKHHTLLHLTNYSSQFEQNNSSTTTNPSTILAKCEPEPNVVTNCASSMIGSQVFLSTAKALVADLQNNMHEVRVLLDSASQSNFITEDMCNRLTLAKEPINLNVMGINQGLFQISHKVQLKIKSRVNHFTSTITCLVLPQITNALPLQTCNVTSLIIPPNIKLADPIFYKSGPIDVLIGADIFYELMCVGQIRQHNLPTLQKTQLGWVVSGRFTGSDSIQPKQLATYLSLNDLHNDVEKFWQTDEFISKGTSLTDEEKYCESFFKQTMSRDDTGKFIVRIPFKPNLSNVGDSYSVAKSRFNSLENRFNKDPMLKNTYKEFIDEYITLKHMTQIEPDDKPSFFLPHHAVIKDSSETTKLRVVFDGSCKLDLGLSINETQCTGPTIQDDLFSIIARFRTYDFVLTGDIAKMYRQVWIHPDDRQYQRIIWRDLPDHPLQFYELNTITYGMTAAPFLAIRCLYQLALENKKKFPIESQIIKRDFYVDDLLTGSNSIVNLRSIKTKVDQILKTAGFFLRKWNSNVEEFRDSKSLEIPITGKVQKILGINWNPTMDQITYSTTLLKLHHQTTKRTILATTAQLFDPLGLLAPIIIVAKLIIQELWQLKIEWDEAVPLSIQTKWLKFKDELKFINRIQIPRHVLISQSISIELHAFSDASEKGYGACIYLRSTNRYNQVAVKLLAAKSRVAPLKNVSLPRLELCAAVLSAQLSNKFKQILNVKIKKEYYWSDSQIVLCWLNSPSNKWKTYVANRVSEIQTLTDSTNWYHVQSSENSADLISRGVLPTQLIKSNIWWHGPQWLSQDTNQWPNNSVQSYIKEAPELRNQSQSLLATDANNSFPIQNYSSINKLKRIVAFCIRFKNNCLSQKDSRSHGPLTVHELKHALISLIKLTQLEFFTRELHDLTRGKSLHPKSTI